MGLHRFKRLYKEYLFIIFAIVFAVKLLLVLYFFNFQVTDNDQALFWLGCHDFSRGIFHTPFIYGCNYGSMLESFLAIPFYLAGMPLYYALPFSNFFWLFLSVIILGKQLDKKYPGKQIGVIVFLLLSFLDTEFYAITFAAKGHMAGIFPAVFALNLMINNTRPFLLILAGLLLGIALQFNPNAIFLIILTFIFIDKLKQFIPLILGGLISLLYKLYTNWFLLKTDNEFLHKQWGVDFTLNNLNVHLEHIDTYLNHVTPVFYKMGFLSLFIPLVLIIQFCRKKDWIKGAFVLAYLLLLTCSLGVSKISDGSPDVLFNYSRFYLSVALCNVLLIAIAFSHLKSYKSIRILISIMPFLIITNSIYNIEESKRIAKNCGDTYAVKKSFVDNFIDDQKALLENLQNSKLHNPIIMVCDYPLYTELLYLSTRDLGDVVIYYHFNRKFYWKLSEIKDNITYDLFICLQFDKLLKKKRIEYAPFFHDNKRAPYFLFRDVKNPEDQIGKLLNY